MKSTLDENHMAHALALARRAGQAGEVPVGAIVVDAVGQVIGAGANASIGTSDPTHHAEVSALRQAARSVGNYRLPGCTLYVTLEPCLMCAGAIVHARIDRLVFGAREPKAGAVESHALLSQDWLNHRVEVSSGVLGSQCGQLLSDFFAQRRGSRA